MKQLGGMNILLSASLQEFYEKGMLNILRMFPRNMHREERLAIEALVYTSYGFFRAYQKLEEHLNRITPVDGNIHNASDADKRDAFLYTWSTIDAAYALSKLNSIDEIQRFFTMSEETRERIETAVRLRNYMDHLSGGFSNIVASRNTFPLFGWLSYQLNPVILDNTIPPNQFYVVQMGSTVIGGSCHIDMHKCSQQNALAAIDNITMHIRKSDRANITRLLAHLTMDLNEFSINSQNHIKEILLNKEFDHGGILSPFSTLTIKGELPGDEQLIFNEIASLLNENSVRTDIKLSPEDNA